MDKWTHCLAGRKRNKLDPFIVKTKLLCSERPLSQVIIPVLLTCLNYCACTCEFFFLPVTNWKYLWLIRGKGGKKWRGERHRAGERGREREEREIRYHIHTRNIHRSVTEIPILFVSISRNVISFSVPRPNPSKNDRGGRNANHLLVCFWTYMSLVSPYTYLVGQHVAWPWIMYKMENTRGRVIGE